LEIPKIRISTNALILRKESTAFAILLPLSSLRSEEKNKNRSHYGNVEIAKKRDSHRAFKRGHSNFGRKGTF